MRHFLSFTHKLIHRARTSITKPSTADTNGEFAPKLLSLKIRPQPSANPFVNEYFPLKVYLMNNDSIECG